MAEPWEWSASRRAEFDAQAAAYDTYRPHYPEALFDGIVHALGTSDATAVEIGAGTGIATDPLARRGVRVLAIEPAPTMAEIAAAKLGERGQVVVATFEDWKPTGPVDLVAAFNSWHWVNPAVGLPKVASLLRPGGIVALAWTEVVQFGQEPFERLAGYERGRVPLAKVIEPHVRLFDEHNDFGTGEVLRFRFERILDADTFVAESRTYPGPHSDSRDSEIRSLITRRFDGAITKVEDAVLYLFFRT